MTTISPATPAAIVAALAAAQVKLPLRMSEQDTGVILDDDGHDIITIDSNGKREDDQVDIIAMLVVSAINHLAAPEPQT
ncbi:hypothetical protein [Rhizobium sp. RU36D]|uniref:hypothetical protein n=1 Tax=Rhizobium sp. RU36D TaxID=1907415 RepID=UPI0009D84864|nr:hypothetical protein [Rhizobium sp. RU36D]SMD18258.1 hypothetical protein SAMN05880593_13452 [Rhizobium sp. RU36D]